MIDLYLEDTPQILQQMKSSREAGDTRELAKAAHTLKSASANVGALELAELCRKAEVAAHGNAQDDALELIAAVVAEFERVKPALEAEREIAPALTA